MFDQPECEEYEVYKAYLNALFWLNQRPSDQTLETAIAAEKRWLAVAATLPSWKVETWKQQYG